MSNLQIKNIVTVQNERKLHLANVLLLSGEESNVGKTALGFRFLTRLSEVTKVIAIKVSHHFHTLTDSLVILKDSDSMTIAGETDKYSGKNSSRYLNAGASQAYYIQCEKESLPALTSWIRDSIPHYTPVICESGELGRTIQPGYTVYIRHGFGRNEQSSQLNAETIINNDHPENVDLDIHWQNNTWQK